MHKRITIVALSLLALLSGGISTAFAVNSPNAPANVSVVSNSALNSLPSAGSLSVTWQKPVVDATHPIPIAYIVSAIGGGATFSTTVTLAAIDTIDYSSVLSGLTGGTAYVVTVTSKSSENATALASSVNATPVTSPATPTTISAVATAGAVALTWSAPVNFGGSSITGYTIKDGTAAETTITDPLATTKTFSGLTGGSTASYSIRAKNANGNSEWVAFASATLPSAPDQPTGVTATAGTTSITVNWVAPTNTGNSAINVYKVSLFNSSGTAVGTPTTSKRTTVEITSVAAGTYTVKVVATNQVGDSPLSTASTSVTIAPPSSLLDNTPVFTPTTLPNLVIGVTQNVSVSVPSAGTVTIVATGTPTGACTYASGVLTAVAVGTCSVRATSPATASYAEAIGTKTFSVTKTLQTITFATIVSQPLPGPLSVSASSTSGLAVSFSAAGNCTNVGNTVSFTGQGECTVTASQVGDTTFATATQVSRRFSITAAVPGGGGNNPGGGGGNNPGPTPTIAPTPAPTPQVTLKPNPNMTPSPTASPTASPTPTPVLTPTTQETSKPATPAKELKILQGAVLVAPVGAKITGPVTTTKLPTGNTDIVVKRNSNLQTVLPQVKKGERVTMVIEDSNGKRYTVASLVASKAGDLKLPNLKFGEKGTYTITIKVGTKTKVLRVKTK